MAEEQEEYQVESTHILYDNEEEDVRLTETQADLLKATLEFLSNPKYFEPPYSIPESWKYTKARKRHIDEFGNVIQSGERYLSSGVFQPTRISFRSLCGLWPVLVLENAWRGVIEDKMIKREAAIKDRIQELSLIHI